MSQQIYTDPSTLGHLLNKTGSEVAPSNTEEIQKLKARVAELERAITSVVNQFNAGMKRLVDQLNEDLE